MNKKLLVLSIVLSISVLGLSGCVKSISDRFSEKIIEESTGGQANVNTQDGTVQVNVDGTSIQAGENITLPANFPTDIYRPEGKLLSSMTNEQSFTISIEVKEAPQEIYAAYQQKLKADGWKVVTSGDFGDMKTVNAEKDNRVFSMIVSKAEDSQTTVVLSQYLKEEQQ